MGNIVNRPILAVPVRLAAVAAFAVTLTDRRKGSPACADPYPGRENSAAGNFGLRARRSIFGTFHANSCAKSGGVSLLTRIKDYSAIFP